MDRHPSLQMVRRRWWVLIVGGVLGASFAFAAQAIDNNESSPPRYRASHLLIMDSASRGANYDRLALIAIAGPVPEAAGKDLDAHVVASPSGRIGGSVTVGGPAGVLTVSAVPDKSTGALAIIVIGDKVGAVKTANAFARELIKHVDRLGVEQYETKLARLQASRAAAVADAGPVDQFDEMIATLTRNGPHSSSLDTLEAASANRAVLLNPPRAASTLSPALRIVFGGVTGVLIAFAVLALLDARRRATA